MAKLKLKKYPKKPKASAGAETIKAYFSRCAEVDRDNARIKRDNDEQKKLSARLRNFKPGKSKAGGSSRRRKKSVAKKSSRRRRR